MNKAALKDEYAGLERRRTGDFKVEGYPSAVLESSHLAGFRSLPPPTLPIQLKEGGI